MHHVGHLPRVEFLISARSQFTINVQNVFRLNQCGMDTSDHGLWQIFRVPGAVTNRVTDIKNDLLTAAAAAAAADDDVFILNSSFHSF